MENILSMRSRRWQLTENNNEMSKEEYLQRLASIGDTIYCVVCEECGESKGTKHIHAFVIFRNAIRGSTLKKFFERAHFEVCVGDNTQNRDYVIKSGNDYLEKGNIPQKSETLNIASAVSDLIVNQGMAPTEILVRYPQYSEFVIKNFWNLSRIYEKIYL